MAQDIMGKIIRYNKPALRLVIFLTLLVLVTVHSYASYTEYDLLQKGYESYLAYQPEKAAEEFRAFLKEFPRSSARDAALFWLGKSLVQSKSVDEARRVFTELKRQFPNSPFVAFIAMQTELPGSEKLPAIREAEPVPQLETSKDSADIRQPEPGRQTDDAITEPTVRTDIAVTPEKLVEKAAEAAMQSSIAAKPQISESQPSAKSETVDERSAGDQGVASAQEDLQTKPADSMMAKKEEPVVKESELKEPTVKEPEVKEIAQFPEYQGTGAKTGKHAVEEEKKLPSITEQAQSDSAGGVLPEGETPIPVDNADEPPGENIKSAQEIDGATQEHYESPDTQRIDAHVLANPDVALPGIVPLDSVPEPENIKVPEIVAIKKAGEQEAVSPQSEVPSEPAPDIMKNVEEPEGKESEVKEPVVKGPELQEPEVKEPEVKVPEVKDSEVKEPAQLQEDQATREETGKQAVEEKKELPLTTEEQTLSDSVGVVLPKEETPIPGDNVRQEDEQVKTGELSLQRASESNTMMPAQTALNKVGIQGAIIWSTGDRNEDFIDEQILYNEAVKLNLSADEDELNELRERYTLGIEEADYLKRFLLICRLIDKKVKEIPGDKIVEVISVRYKDAGQRERPELAAELQALANKGVAFEDIGISYPDVVHFRIFPFQELPEWIQERIQGLQNYEIGVIWSEEGYMILKPIKQMYSYDPFEELSSEKREKLTAYVRSWIAELKGANTR
jgi:hypothetical protein